MSLNNWSLAVSCQLNSLRSCPGNEWIGPSWLAKLLCLSALLMASEEWKMFKIAEEMGLSEWRKRPRMGRGGKLIIAFCGVNIRSFKQIGKVQCDSGKK